MTPPTAPADHPVLSRIDRALDAAADVLASFIPGDVAATAKPDDSPLTEADLAVNDALRQALPQTGEGWLSEETRDDDPDARLAAERVWIVDPLDGTREFVAGIPEWCVSIGLVENGRAIAGGILNPVASLADHGVPDPASATPGGIRVIGADGEGVWLNGVRVSDTTKRAGTLASARILASRSEVDRGEWERFRDRPFTVEAVGSVAFKLALVAAGLADATWSLVPKHEWDIAAGIALVNAAGGRSGTRELGGRVWHEPRFNLPVPKVGGLIAATRALSTDADWQRLVDELAATKV